MKKFISVFLLSLLSFGANSQVNYDQTYGDDTLFYNCYFGADPAAFPYLIVVDTGSIVFNSDTVKLGEMHDAVNIGIPSTLIWVDPNGVLKVSEVDSIPLVSNQITDGLGYIPLSVEVDGFVTNEGSLTVGAGTGSTSLINSNTSGSTPVTISAGTNITVAEAGNTITIASTAGNGTVTSVGLTSSDFSVSGSPVTTSGNITADLTTTGVSAGTYDWVTVDTKGRVTAATNAPLPTTIASGGRNFNQAYQISSTRPTTISVSVQISCNLSLTGGQAGNIQLQISANGSSGWITVAQLTASNTGTLTIGLNTTQVSGGQLVYEGLPAGYYWRILTTNTTGTPTYTFNGGFEKVY